MAAGQVRLLGLTHRYREQAPSHTLTGGGSVSMFSIALAQHFTVYH